MNNGGGGNLGRLYECSKSKTRDSPNNKNIPINSRAVNVRPKHSTALIKGLDTSRKYSVASPFSLIANNCWARSIDFKEEVLASCSKYTIFTQGLFSI